MLIEMQEKQLTDKTIEVDLPVYSRHDLEYGTIYHKVYEGKNGLLIIYAINHDKGRCELSVETISSNLGTNGDYYLGRGEFKSNQEEWKKARDRAINFLSEFTV